MNNINDFNTFVNERFNYNTKMNILDLIHVLEQQPKNNIIVARNEKISRDNRNGEDLYLISEFVEIPSENMMMDNIGYTTRISGKDYKFYTHNIETNPNNMLGRTFIDDEERPNELNLPPHKTVSQLIEEAKKIPNPENALFFIPSFPTMYEPGDYDTTFEIPMALATYNISTYPLTKNDVIVSGQMGAEGELKESANMFMGIGKEQGGKYHYKSL